MGKATRASNWVEAYLEWNDQGHAQDRPPSSIGNDSVSQASEQFVAAYLEWIDSALPAVQPDRNVNVGKPATHSRKVFRHVILEEPAVPSVARPPATRAQIHPA